MLKVENVNFGNYRKKIVVDKIQKNEIYRGIWNNKSGILNYKI